MNQILKLLNSATFWWFMLIISCGMPLSFYVYHGFLYFSTKCDKLNVNQINKIDRMRGVNENAFKNNDGNYDYKQLNKLFNQIE